MTPDISTSTSTDIRTSTSRSLSLLVRGLRRPKSSPRADRRDAVTGLLHRDPFLDEIEPLVARAHSEMRELAVVSVLVADIDVPASPYTESERNSVLAIFGAQLAGEQSPTDIAGRVGLAEIVWVSLIQSRSEAWRFLAGVRTELDAALAAEAADASYRFGVTLSRGREVAVGQLIDEARERRDLGAVSAAS